MNRNYIPPGTDGKPFLVIKVNWAFKLKCLPDGIDLNYKAHYCVSGDFQTAGVDYFKTYDTVVQWSDLRLVLTIILTTNWYTKPVDYNNSFSQVDLKEEIFIYPPRGFGGSDGISKILDSSKVSMGFFSPPKHSLVSSGLVSLNGYSFSQNHTHAFS